MSIGKKHNEVEMMTELERLSGVLGLAEGAENRAKILLEELGWRTIPPNSLEMTVAACVLVAERLNKTPVPIVVVARHVRRCGHAVDAQEKTKLLGRIFKGIVSRLNLRLPLSDPVDFVSWIARAVYWSQEVAESAVDILRKAQVKHPTESSSPVRQAAGALYVAGHLERDSRTQSVVAEAAGVSQSAIRTHHNRLTRLLEIDRDFRRYERAQPRGTRPTATG